MSGTAIYRMREPEKSPYAQTWYRGKHEATLCTDCLGLSLIYLQPLAFEWWPGSDLVGDFVWMAPQRFRVAVTDRAVEVLQAIYPQVQTGPVKMWQYAGLVRPRKPSKKTKPRVWLPYEGPSLFELVVNDVVPADVARSTFLVPSWAGCSSCGHFPGPPLGVEYAIGDYADGGYVWQHVPREPKMGLFVREDLVESVGVFRVRQFQDWILCTEQVKHSVQESRLTNVEFREVGETFT